MTAGVRPAIATTIAPAAGRASRSAETSQGGFDEALGSVDSRTDRKPVSSEAGANTHRWRQHGTRNEMAKPIDNTPVLKLATSEGKPESIDAIADDDLANAAAAAESVDTEVEDTEVEDKATDDGEEDASLPVQIKAEHAISVMMAMAPTKQHDASRDTAGQMKSGEATDQLGMMQSGKAARPAADQSAVSLAADKSAATPAASDTDTTKTGTRAITPPPVKDDTSTVLASQVRGVAIEHKTQAGTENKTGQEAAKAAKAADASSNQEARAASGQSVAAQTATDDGAGGGGRQSNAGIRDQRDAAPEARRVEPQSVVAKVSVVSQQSALPPMAAPVLNANATAIVTAVDAQQGPRRLSNSSPLAAQAAAQPMRSLKIQLHPAELGVVTVSLKAAGEQLSVELRVENQDAYHRLSADSEAIVKSLRTLGYDIDRVSILQPQAATTGMTRTDAGAGSGSFSRDASSFQSGNSGSSGERSGGQASGRGDRGDAQRGDQAQQAYRDRTGSGLYI